MQRQSLGSPTKTPQHAHDVVNDNVAVTLTPPSLYQDDNKPRKTAPLKPAERYIHLIPLLTILCFLILYISSHNPSEKELAQFNGINSFHKPTDSIDIDNISESEQVLEIKRGDILAIRSLKNLHEMHKESSFSKYHLHRKIGDF